MGNAGSQDSSTDTFSRRVDAALRPGVSDHFQNGRIAVMTETSIDVGGLDFRIIHHHVGARGNVPLPLDPESPIRNDFAVYYYDADESALNESLNALIRVGQRTLLPYCIGAKNEQRTFRVANDVYASSLYPFNEDYADYCKPTYMGQAVMGVGCKTAREIQVEVHALDEICRNEAPEPDYLSIDAEGAEFDILQGASNALSSSVVWLRSEMWIHEVYKGAPTFATSLGFLNKNGYELFSLDPYGDYEAVELPLGSHCIGQTLGAEATFHKSLKSLVAEAAMDRAGTILKLYKLAFLAALNGGMGLCCQSMNEADALGGTFFIEDGTKPPAAYLVFLRRVRSLVANLERNIPKLPDFSRKIHTARALSVEEVLESGNSEARARIARERQQISESVRVQLEAEIPTVEKFLRYDSVPLEDHFRKFGLSSQAETIKNKRKTYCRVFLDNYRKFTGERK